MDLNQTLNGPKPQNKTFVSALEWLINRKYATNMHAKEKLANGEYVYLKCDPVCSLFDVHIKGGGGSVV